MSLLSFPDWPKADSETFTGYGHQPEAAIQKSKSKGSFGVGRNIVAGYGGSVGNGKATAVSPAPEDTS
jgi:hypothetical protein